VPLIEFSPEELHLDPARTARLRKIQQLPRLEEGQTFGAFILSFSGGRLPQGAIRRLVARLVRQRRATRPSAAGPWDLHDIIFFCVSEEGVPRVHVVSFREVDGRATLKVISWSTESTPNRIALLAQRELTDLIWGDLGITVDARDRAFALGYRQEVRDARDLAAQMAEVARHIRGEVLELLEIETPGGPMRRLLAEIKKNLDESVRDERFADMYAQTMVYGLLAARITHPADFGADAVRVALTFDNPFLDAIYGQFRDAGDRAFDLDEMGLRDLAASLGAIDVEAILADFGTEEMAEDPVVYFYAEFLEQYDPAQRRDLGAYYTPIQLVRFMVRAVDEVLRTRCDLPQGIADPTTWREHAARVGYELPSGVDPDSRVVRAIDPATGTGTFLLEWIRQTTEMSRTRRGGGVGELDALEISLASYAVAHLKSDVALASSGMSATRVNIRLADTLAGERELNLLDDDPVSAEGHAADGLKYRTPHTVVVGNPPYDRVERSTVQGYLFEPGRSLRPGRSLFDDLLDPAREHTIFSHIASLYNLYVYFWRWAIHKVFELRPTGPGVVCFVTASSWLTGPGFVGLRALARRMADEVIVVDLGGDGHGAIRDDNVFPIRTPIAIVLLVRSGGPRTQSLAPVRIARISGSREEKLALLATASLTELDFQELTVSEFEPLRQRQGTEIWHTLPALADLLPWQQPGCKWNRTWPIAPEPTILRARWRRLLRSTNPGERARCFVTSRTGRNITTQVGDLARLCDLPPRAAAPTVMPYGFRSFDLQWVLADPRISSGYRPVLWSSLSDQQMFLATAMTGVLGDGPAMTVSMGVPDKHYFNGRGGRDILPAFRDARGQPNSDPALLARLGQLLGTGPRSSRPVDHLELVSYLFGLLAGADYTGRFSQELSVPGPRVPLTASRELFDEMAEHGGHLLWLQTYGQRLRTAARDDFVVSAAIRWARQPTYIPDDPSEINYDEDRHELQVADGLLRGVGPDAWSFEVSRMQVLKKWLGYRTRSGTGRATSSTSPLDAIRPDTWSAEWSGELRALVHVITETVAHLPQGRALLDAIMEGPLIYADQLPQPPEWLRRPPDAGAGGAEDLGLDD
jgi:hypothetical protein